ncbi:hypothetical protein JCM10207_008248 [Rhodosporidiobolus poonsookiae]
MSSGLHRRNSSAAAYQQLDLQPGIGDVTDELESYSTSTPRGRTGSFAARQKALEELEEKEGFIPTTQYDAPQPRWSDGRRGKKGWFGWKSKLVLMMLLGGGIGAGVYYVFYLGDGASEEASHWSKGAAARVSSAAESAATGVANYAYSDEQVDQFDDDKEYYTDKEASEYGEYEEEDSSTTAGRTTSTTSKGAAASASSYKSNALSQDIKAGAFSAAISATVAKLLENGTLAAYTWHEILPSLNETGVSTAKKQDSGRLIVVGDLHGTYTSLTHLLKRLSFTSHDTLLHTGDILAKSPLESSLKTIALLRRLGAKGVRGNHDQKVIEWRKWMEAYGPLDLSSFSSSTASSSASRPSSTSGSKFDDLEDNVVGAGSYAQAGFRAAKDNAKSGFRKVAAQGQGGAAKLGSGAGAAHPRSKRGWLDWLTGNDTPGEAGVEELLQAEAGEDLPAGAGSGEGASSWADEDAVEEDGPGWYEINEAEERVSEASASSATSQSRSATQSAKASASSGSSPTTTTGGARRPFGRPTTLSSSSSSTRSSTSSAARPLASAGSFSSLAATSSSTSFSSGALLGPLYSHLSPTLTASERKKLGIVVPEGWEWGGEHFEIARHLSSKDVEYLESLPLTLWVEEIKSWVVHAGMVPWTSLSTTLSRLPISRLSTTSAEAALPAHLTSTSPLEFSPASSLSRLLTRSSRTALLLEPLNTDPYTLLNMRTLNSAGSTSSKNKGVKGAKGGWTVSSKGRKAGAGSKPWWSVWEEGMKECGYDDEERCEEAGVVYGHWAGQGLQVQKHSIGLDSGCVYGRRLSALVVPLGSNSSSPLSSPGSTSLLPAPSSLLSNFTSTLSNLTSAALNSTDDEASSAEPSTTTRARPNWHGGLNKVTKTAASALSSASSAAASSTSIDRAHPSATMADDDFSAEDEEDDSASYYRESSSDVDAEDAESGSYFDAALSSVASGSATTTPTAAAKPWWRPWTNKHAKAKRAPPQGRPGVAPWAEEHEAPPEYFETEGYEEDEDEAGVDRYADEDEEDGESSTSTARRGRPTATATSSSSSSSSSTSSTTDRRGKGKPISSSTSTSTGSSVSASVSVSSSKKRPSVFAAAVEPQTEEEEDDEPQLSDDAFAEQQVVLAPAKGVKAWVVSVDCAGEIDIE